MPPTTNVAACVDLFAGEAVATTVAVSTSAAIMMVTTTAVAGPFSIVSSSLGAGAAAPKNSRHRSEQSYELEATYAAAVSVRSRASRSRRGPPRRHVRGAPFRAAHGEGAHVSSREKEPHRGAPPVPRARGGRAQRDESRGRRRPRRPTATPVVRPGPQA